MFKFLTAFCLLLFTYGKAFSTPLNALAIDLPPYLQQKNEKQEKKKAEGKPEKTPIKEVPKAKRQVKPVAVKPNVKIKPIKIIKPKIKRP